MGWRRRDTLVVCVQAKVIVMAIIRRVKASSLWLKVIIKPGEIHLLIVTAIVKSSKPCLIIIIVVEPCHRIGILC